jgi:diguanylate cyclase (GGDEF)-like protein
MTRGGSLPVVAFAAGAVAALIGSGLARARASARAEVERAEPEQAALRAPASDRSAPTACEVAERHSLEEELHRLELTDTLTGAANRVRFRQRLAEVIASDSPSGALLILDLDDFKLVNELYGHTYGDLLLIEATRRLEIVAHQFDGACLSRLGGDEFALLLPDVTLPEMRWVCTGLLNRLRQPVALGSAEIEVGTSIGLVMLDEDLCDVDDALRDGDLAMYAAKAAGKNRWKQFAPQMHDDLVARLTLEGELAVALDEDQLDVAYQPLVRLDGQRIVGVEALVRWNHPTRGLIPPEEFLVAAERGPLIHRLGSWILRAACQQLVDWSEELGPNVLHEVAVNVSPRQLLDPHFTETVADALAVTGLDPRRLVLEITESTAMAPNSQEQLLALRATGVRLSIDDFGTGHSSLSRLAALPVNALKVDRSFVRDIPSTGDAPLVRAMIAMAHSLGLTVVAEGIETERQMDYLTALGCEHGQGYLFSRPVPAAELVSLLVRAAA